MQRAVFSIILGAGLFLVPIAQTQIAHAQTVTATCKDGSAFSGTTRSGACKGHKGVATWGTADAAPSGQGVSPAAAPATNPSPAAAPPSTGAGKTAGTAAATGGPGQVWVNTASKVYHCPGDRYYGKTKAGSFMSQSAAVAAGAHPSGGKACPS